MRSSVRLEHFNPQTEELTIPDEDDDEVAASEAQGV